MDVYTLVDYFVIAAGIYLIYLAVQMKRTGEIRQNGMLSKGIDLNKAHDPAGFIRVMVPWDFLFGTGLALSGGISVYISRFGGPAGVSSVIYAVMFAFTVLFAVVSAKAQNKYLK